MEQVITALGDGEQEIILGQDACATRMRQSFKLGAALTYYHDYRGEIDQEVETETEEVERSLRSSWPYDTATPFGYVPPRTLDFCLKLVCELEGQV